MTKLVMLGVGNGITENLYNTCFLVQNDKGNFLVDTGGSVQLITRLRQAGVNYKEINNIFISHAHNDHLFGLFWYLKKMSGAMSKGEIKDKIKIYCNDVVYNAIDTIINLTFPARLIDNYKNYVEFVVLNDGDKHYINGIEYTFFDTKAAKIKQYGFEFTENNKRVVFLGDETINQELYPRVKDADYVFHEAFCLDSEEEIFKAREKKHSTVKIAAKIMNGLNVKNLILYHTEETHGEERQKLYLEEGKKVFNGNLIIPNDLDIVDIK